MAIIALEGMHFFAYHGYYDEEQILGNEFVLDVLVDVNIMMAARTDDLYAGFDPEDKRPTTANYETIYLICKMEMKEPARLLETLVDRIAESIEDHFDNVKGVLVRLRKLHPPLGGRVDSSWLLTTRGGMDASYAQLFKAMF
ncbi:MAG: dihydroneopterin aldolase [Chitinophagales bacterium]|nr:dihydroneopterin aldolase [Chitinophagales bacterium]